MDCPESFVRFDEYVRRTLQQTDKRKVSAVYVLPSSLRQIALQAEQSDEFEEFVGDLAEQHKIVQEGYDGCDAVADVLRRCGYYQSVLAGEERREYWQPIIDRLFQRKRMIEILFFLEGCRFAKEQFSLGGYSVEKMSGAALQRLAVPTEFCKDFYPDENLSVRELSWLADGWFLRKTTAAPIGVFEQRAGPRPPVQESARVRGRSVLIGGPLDPVELAVGFFRSYDDLGNYAPRQGIAADLLPVLTLSLYDCKFFSVPAILVAEPGWRLLRPRFIGLLHRAIRFAVGRPVNCVSPGYLVEFPGPHLG